MGRFDLEDEQYFGFRQHLSSRSFSVQDLDHFTLYVGIHNFARKKFIIDEFERTLDVTGNIYEFGTWKGATMMLLASWYKLRRPNGHKLLYVFDTFQGLGAGTPEDGNAFGAHQGEYHGPLGEIQELTERRGLTDHVRFVEGDVVETAALHFAQSPFPKVSLALLDMDLYAPTKCAIDCVLPNLSPNGKVIFDEGTCAEWEGEQKALAYLIDRADKRGIRYQVEENHLTRQSTTVFTRLP